MTTPNHPDPAPSEVPGLARELLEDARTIEDALKGVTQDVIGVARRVSMVTDRRRAAIYGGVVLMARDVLDQMLEDLIELAECADHLYAALGTPDAHETPDVADARATLGAVRRIVQVAGDSGRESARIGRLTTERVSDFAEFEMLYEQTLRDLRLRDAAAVDARMPRLVELERDLVTKGVAEMLAEVRRGREELAAGDSGGRTGRGRAGRDHDDDDHLI